MLKKNLAAALGLVLCAAASGCSSGSDAAQSQSETTPGAAERAIAEADIIQVDQGRLYAMSAAGTISIVDVSTPGRLALLGQTSLGGTPFEMYRRGELLVTMWNGAYSRSGQPVPPVSPQAAASQRTSTARDPSAGAGVVVLDLRDPAAMKQLATFAVPGEIADSRIVGDALYLATYENGSCYSCDTTARTIVTSFDVKDPTAMRKVEQLSFAVNAPESYQLAWGISSWKRSIYANSQRLYVGGHSEINPELYADPQKVYDEGTIDVLDISDPSGHMVRGARLAVPGSILSRWQLDERNGVLRVISQRGAGRTTNGIDMPRVQTFRVDSAQSFTPLGQTRLQLSQQEGLRTVRFDDTRAYAITYRQTDPLYTIDLSDPGAPTVRGELHMPGYLFHIEPRGDRLIGLGIDSADHEGSLNVSLIDVQDLNQPRLLSRVPFGSPDVGSDFAIVNFELPEDQDRIQKALRVFADGLIAVPFTYAQNYSPYDVSSDVCASMQGGVQLVDWTNDRLIRRALLPMRGNPRRAFQNNGELIAVSDSNVTAFSLADHDAAVINADVEIGPCVPKADPYGDYAGGYDDAHHWPFACSTSATRPGSATGAWFCGLLGLLAFARARRRSNRGALSRAPSLGKAE